MDEYPVILPNEGDLVEHGNVNPERNRRGRDRVEWTDLGRESSRHNRRQM